MCEQDRFQCQINIILENRIKKRMYSSMYRLKKDVNIARGFFNELKQEVHKHLAQI